MVKRKIYDDNNASIMPRWDIMTETNGTWNNRIFSRKLFFFEAFYMKTHMIFYSNGTIYPAVILSSVLK